MNIEPTLPPLKTGPDGATRVEGTHVLLETVAIEHRGGATVEEIVARYPSLTPGVTHAVVSYVLQHEAEVAEYLTRRLDVARDAQSVPHSFWDRYWGLIASVGILTLEGLLVHFGWSLGATDAQRQWALMSGVFGATVGVTAGLIASPLDETEGKSFASIASVFSAFMTGFLLSKIDRIFDEASKQGAILHSAFLAPLCVFTGSGLLAAVFVWLWRSYGFS